MSGQRGAVRQAEAVSVSTLTVHPASGMSSESSRNSREPGHAGDRREIMPDLGFPAFEQLAQLGIGVAAQFGGARQGARGQRLEAAPRASQAGRS